MRIFSTSLLRQNQPPIAVSARRTLQLLVEANRCRSVNVPSMDGIDAQGNGCAALVMSFDSGIIWREASLHGYLRAKSVAGSKTSRHGLMTAGKPN